MPRGKLAVVRGNSPRARNSFATPDAIHVHRAEVGTGEEFAIDLPAASVAVLVLEQRP
jgi:hypothetical protein